MLFSIATLVYLPVGTAFSQLDDLSNNKKIHIVNNLDVPLEFKEITNKEHMKLKENPPDKVEAGETGSFGVVEEGLPAHLNVKYYVNTSSSGEDVGIIFKNEVGGSPHCPKDHPDDITEVVKHCGSFDKNTSVKWEYIFSSN